jgi:hypothetical protein
MRNAAAVLLLLALPPVAAAQVTMPKGVVPAQEAGRAARFNYVPTERAVRWLPGDTLLVAHFDMYGGATAYYVNCEGSGFFKVPMGGRRAVPVAGPFCSTDRPMVASPDGGSVLFFADPAYIRTGPNSTRADAPLLRWNLTSLAIDTLRLGCGTGYKDIAVSATGQIAWTGRCWTEAELAKDPACAAAGVRVPTACSSESRKAIYVTPLRGGEMTRLGDEAPADVHDPSWSPDGKSVVVAVGPNGNQGRWELSHSPPSTLMIIDASGARYIGAQGEVASWSPDGQWIAFFGEDAADVGYRGGPRSVGPRIYVIHPDGSGRREVFVNDLQIDYPDWFWGGVSLEERQGKVFGPAVWSPDSKWFAFARQAEDGASIWRVEVETGRAERVTIPE